MATDTTKAAPKLPKEVFDVEVNNHELLKLAYDAYLANSRTSAARTKTRGEVSGGGKKPWRQKGTGRARAGSIRSPIWRGGGRAFAAKPQDWSQKVNRKMYRGAMQCILAELIRQDRLILVEELSVSGPKTKELIAKLNDLGAPRALIVTKDVDENLYLAARNIPHVNVLGTNEVDPVSLIAFDKVIMTVEAAKQFEEALA